MPRASDFGVFWYSIGKIRSVEHSAELCCQLWAEHADAPHGDLYACAAVK